MPVAAVVNPSFGAKLRLGSGASPYTYAEMAQIVNFDGPSAEVGTRETTNLDSTAKTFAPSILDNGEVSGQLQLDPQCDSHVALQALIDAPAIAPFQILFGDTVNGGTAGVGGTTKTFLGILTKLAPTGVKREENLVADFGIKVTGGVVTAKGT